MKNKTTIKIVRNYLLPVAIAVLLYICTITIFNPYIVSGNSMNPTLNDGDILICEDLPSKKRPIEYGDIVIYKKDWKNVVKRVVALPNDTVDFKDGVLYVNNSVSPYQFEEIEDIGILHYPLTLGSNEYFCMGDNRNHSRDSRDIGVITPDMLKNRVVKKL